jgi:hypothetical protein
VAVVTLAKLLLHKPDMTVAQIVAVVVAVRITQIHIEVVVAAQEL